MTTPIATPIHEVVRQHYASLARASDAGCGTKDCACTTQYPIELTAEVPNDIAGFSLGCGDPITLASLQPGDVVVDLGSGGGLDCFLAGKRVGPTGRIIGIDMTPDMLAKARANAVKVGATNVEFRQGYIEALPVADGEATVIISNCVINLSPDKPQVFREMFRALRPGGHVAVSDVVTNGPLPEAVQTDMEAWGACVAGALDIQDFKAGLEAAGFVAVTIQAKGDPQADPATLPAHTPISALITAHKPSRLPAKG